MCGRYSIFAPPGDLEARFEATPTDEALVPRYNAAPGQSLPVVTGDRPAAIRRLRWGLVPSWADDRSVGNRLINARAETLAERPAFRDAYASRRCLVLADGFYEWAAGPDGKRPHRITLPSGEPFAMAGLWERWTPPTTQTGLDAFDGEAPDVDPEPLETFTVVTTRPNEDVAAVHDRMPVVLPRGEERRWLSAPDDDLLRPYPGGLQVYPVSTAVNDPSNDSPAVVEPVDG